jgi:hypothetical protein
LYLSDFSQFREDLRLNSLKVGRVKLSCNQVAGAEMADTWDEEENCEPSLMLDWTTAERIAASDPVVAQLIADIDADFTAEDAARESGKQRIFGRGRLLFKATHQFNVRG